MAYLNLDIDFLEHEKTKRLEFKLGPEAAIYPIRLWALAAKSSPEAGLFKNMEPQELEHLLGWKGAPGLCFDELCRIGFVEKTEKDIFVHNWKKHEGHIIAFVDRARHAAKKRWKKIRNQYKCLDDATSIAQASLTDTPNLTLPSLTIPIQKKEKIAPSPASAGPPEPPVLTFPTVGPNSEWGLFQKKIAEYQGSFPGVDVLAEARHARQWCIDNPRKRKTPGGMPAFLTAWFSRTQNRGGHNGAGNQTRIVGDAKPTPGKYAKLGE